MEEIDRWALRQLNAVVARVRSAYERYEFHLATQAIHRFSTVTLSALYLDVLKDRLYTSPSDARARRSAQTAMRLVLDALTRLMAPVLCFTAEEVWQTLKGSDARNAIEESIHTLEFPGALDLPEDEGIDERWDRLLGVREVVLKSLEVARADGLRMASAFLTLSVLFLDQATKAVVTRRLMLYPSTPVIPGLFHITLVTNRGALFGWFHELADPYRGALFTVVPIMAILLMLVFQYRTTINDAVTQSGLAHQHEQDEIGRAHV